MLSLSLYPCNSFDLLIRPLGVEIKNTNSLIPEKPDQIEIYIPKLPGHRASQSNLVSQDNHFTIVSLWSLEDLRTFTPLFKRFSRNS